MSEESKLTKTSTTAINVEVNAKEITSIWDDDMVEKYTDEAGKKRWRCLWCKQSYSSWSATKALFHVAKVGGENINLVNSERSMQSTVTFTKHLFV